MTWPRKSDYNNSYLSVQQVLKFRRYFGCCPNSYTLIWARGHIQMPLVPLISHYQDMCDEVSMLAMHSYYAFTEYQKMRVWFLLLLTSIIKKIVFKASECFLHLLVLTFDSIILLVSVGEGPRTQILSPGHLSYLSSNSSKTSIHTVWPWANYSTLCTSPFSFVKHE